MGKKNTDISTATASCQCMRDTGRVGIVSCRRCPLLSNLHWPSRRSPGGRSFSHDGNGEYEETCPAIRTVFNSASRSISRAYAKFSAPIKLDCSPSATLSGFFLAEAHKAEATMSLAERRLDEMEAEMLGSEI